MVLALCFLVLSWPGVLSLTGAPTPWPRPLSGRPYNPLCIHEEVLSDPLRPTQSAAAFSNTLYPTYNPARVCGHLSPSCPIPCPDNPHIGCERAQKVYYLCSGDPLDHDLRHPVDIHDIPWSEWNADPVNYKFMPMYRCQCTRRYGQMPLEVFSVGGGNTWLASLHFAQQAAADPDIPVVYAIPEFRPRDSIDGAGNNASPQVHQLITNSQTDQAQSANFAIAMSNLLHNWFSGLVAAKQLLFSGYSWGAETALIQRTGWPSVGLTPYQGPGTIVDIILDDPTVQAFSPADIENTIQGPLAQFCGQSLITFQGCLVADSLNTETYGNGLWMINGTSHQNLGAGDLTTWNVLQARGVQPAPPAFPEAQIINRPEEAIVIFGRTLKTRMYGARNHRGCHVFHLDAYCDLLSIDSVYQDQQQQPGGSSFDETTGEWSGLDYMYWSNHTCSNHCLDGPFVHDFGYQYDSYSSSFYGYNKVAAWKRANSYSPSAYQEIQASLPVFFPQPTKTKLVQCPTVTCPAA